MGDCNISSSIYKTDHKAKVEGRIQYIGDLKWEGMLYAKTLRSSKARAYIHSIYIPVLPQEYEIVDYKDVLGKNCLKVIVEDQPLFAEKQVNFIGEPILLVVGPDKQEVLRILSEIEVQYEDRQGIFTMEQAENGSIEPIYGEDNYFAQYTYQKGDVTESFENAVEILEEQFETGYQEHVYIEPQGVVGVYEADKVMVYGSMQCPYYVKNAVMQAFGWEEHRVRIVQATTGGGFGGKEDYPSLLACHAALAAYKTKKPVQLLLDRKEDMEVSTKRHPGILKFKTALDADNNILGMEVEIKLNGGAYAGLSSVVLQRSLISAVGVYNIPNLRVHGKVLATNTVPTGAFRGFGAPQSFFAVEMHMEHLAKKLGQAPLQLKKRYMVSQGDPTSTNGKFRHVVMLPQMIEEVEKMSGYSQKHRDRASIREKKKRGIGMSLFFHGCGFTGRGERDYIRATVKLRKYQDGIVEILAANVDMGQGLQTTLNKIVAAILGKPVEEILYQNPDTDRVPDSGPTVASRTLMIVGKLLERAAWKLKNQWEEGKEQEITEHYQHPELIPWDEKKFCGDAYPTYSWGVNVVEVEVDPLTAQIDIVGVWSVFDVGNAIDERILRGQIEGGILQGLGYASLEVMQSQQGKILQNSITDYIIPTAKDIVKMETKLLYNPYEEGPFGAKGAGELTLIGGAPAFTAAVENALGISIQKIPITPEELMEVLANGTKD